jgi:hypothetical protein
MIATSTQDQTGPVNTRRWPRYEAHIPVLISFKSKVLKRAVPGLASEISQSGMTLYGGASLQAGDVIEVEFRTPSKHRVVGVVRNRSGYCFGLEFLRPMSSDDAIANEPRSGWAADNVGDEPNAWWKVWLAKHRGHLWIAIAAGLLLFVAQKAL